MARSLGLAHPAVYCLTVQGRLDARWADWLEGFTPVVGETMTTLTGRVADQAALHGLLNRIRDLGLVLVAVKRLPDSETTPEAE